MEELGFLELGLYIIGLFVVNLFSFSALLAGAAPKMRWLFWVTFYLSMAGLSYFWLAIFFPEFLTWQDPFSKINLYASLSLFSILASAFFSWLFLNSKQKKSKNSELNKIVGQWMIIFSLFFLLAVTAVAINMRLESEVLNEAKI